MCISLLYIGIEILKPKPPLTVHLKMKREFLEVPIRYAIAKDFIEIYQIFDYL